MCSFSCASGNSANSNHTILCLRFITDDATIESITRIPSADAKGRSDKPLLVCRSTRACPLSPVGKFPALILNTSNAKEVAKCSLCSVEFHPTCCRIRTVAKLSKMFAKALTTWRCDECDVDDSRKSNSASFASLEKTMISERDSLEEVKLKLSTVEKDNLTPKEDCGLLKKENQRLAENVSQLKTEIDELHQRSRLNNIEIRGVPLTKGDDIYAVVESIARVIGVLFNRGGISIAHRLPAPRDRRFHPSIVVQFISRSIRGE
ncbi:hypothetical protein J6590_084244 [Homalodisca vitripennis]|nr:hypothetical protein J6590_084244 [Homalodisca vitripennis]